jgi:type VI secretion system protein ImpM
MPPAEPPGPGWYGKIPNLGDFASRRLPSRFIVTWDDWLQRALACSRAQLGDQWLDMYLTSPVWRFLLMPGVCGNTAWAGVLMPSVDRVGRYFPLTIAIELARITLRRDWLERLSAWLGRAEGTALSTLDLSVTPERLDQALDAIPVPDADADPDPVAEAALRLAECARSRSSHPIAARIPGADAWPAVLAATGAELLAAAGFGRSLWWSNGREGRSPMLTWWNGLPEPDDFVHLLDGTGSGLPL